MQESYDVPAIEICSSKQAVSLPYEAALYVTTIVSPLARLAGSVFEDVALNAELLTLMEVSVAAAHVQQTMRVSSGPLGPPSESQCAPRSVDSSTPFFTVCTYVIPFAIATEPLTYGSPFLSVAVNVFPPSVEQSISQNAFVCV